MIRSAVRALTVGAAALTALTACGTAAPSTDTGAKQGSITIYSGRNEQLVGGLLEQIRGATGTAVEIRYGDSAELAAQILEEGAASPADLFFSQDAGALGALSGKGLLAELPKSALEVVPSEYRAKDGTWVATSARARVVAYDPKQVKEADLPKSADDLLDPKWQGKIGYAPTNASWQSFVTALRVLRGEDGAKDWLTKFKANGPKAFEKNGLILDAVDTGQIALGLINHYYWYEKAGKVGADKINAKIHYITGEDPAGLINVAGAGVLKSSKNSEAANKAIEFLLSERAQEHFANKTAEYPVRTGVPTGSHKLEPLSTLNGPDINLSDLASLEKTLVLLQDVGLS